MFLYLSFMSLCQKRLSLCQNIFVFMSKKHLSLCQKTKKEYPDDGYSFFISSESAALCLCGIGALLLDAGLLTCELAQVVQLGTANLTNLVHLDAVDVR